MKSPLSTLTAIISGVLLLLATFIRIPLMDTLRSTMVGWAAILIGIAGLVGIINLVFSHWVRLFSSEKKDFYSIVLLLAFFLSAGAGLFFSPADQNYQKIVTAIQVPIEASLLAVLAASLAFVAFQLLKRRASLMGVVFALSFIVFLILGSGWVTGVESIPIIGSLLTLLPLAGARGLLLGIGLASLTAGLRIIFGADRPYSG